SLRPPRRRTCSVQGTCERSARRFRCGARRTTRGLPTLGTARSSATTSRCTRTRMWCRALIILYSLRPAATHCAPRCRQFARIRRVLTEHGSTGNSTSQWPISLGLDCASDSPSESARAFHAFTLNTRFYTQRVTYDKKTKELDSDDGLCVARTFKPGAGLHPRASFGRISFASPSASTGTFNRSRGDDPPMN